MRQSLITVGTVVAVPILTANAEAVSAVVQADPANTTDVYLGDPKVSPAGVGLRPGQAMTVYLAGGQDLYGIATVAGQLVRVLSAPGPSEFITFAGPQVPGQTVVKQLAALVVTAETAIWTPAAGKRFRLAGYGITQGVVPGAIVLKDGTGGPTILTIPPTTIGVAQTSPPLGAGLLSAAANNPLTATGVATETITGFVIGTEE